MIGYDEDLVSSHFNLPHCVVCQFSLTQEMWTRLVSLSSRGPQFLTRNSELYYNCRSDINIIIIKRDIIVAAAFSLLALRSPAGYPKKLVDNIRESESKGKSCEEKRCEQPMLLRRDAVTPIKRAKRH